MYIIALTDKNNKIIAYYVSSDGFCPTVTSLYKHATIFNNFNVCYSVLKFLRSQKSSFTSLCKDCSFKIIKVVLKEVDEKDYPKTYVISVNRVKNANGSSLKEPRREYLTTSLDTFYMFTINHTKTFDDLKEATEVCSKIISTMLVIDPLKYYDHDSIKIRSYLGGYDFEDV